MYPTSPSHTYETRNLPLWSLALRPPRLTSCNSFAVLLQSYNKLIARKETLLQRAKSGYLLKSFFIFASPWWSTPNAQNLRGFINNLGKFLSRLYKFIFYNMNINDIEERNWINPSHYWCSLSIMINIEWFWAKGIGARICWIESHSISFL